MFDIKGKYNGQNSCFCMRHKQTIHLCCFICIHLDWLRHNIIFYLFSLRDIFFSLGDIVLSIFLFFGLGEILQSCCLCLWLHLCHLTLFVVCHSKVCLDMGYVVRDMGYGMGICNMGYGIITKSIKIKVVKRDEVF